MTLHGEDEAAEVGGVSLVQATREADLDTVRWAVIGGERVTWPRSSPLIGQEAAGVLRQGRARHYQQARQQQGKVNIPD